MALAVSIIPSIGRSDRRITSHDTAAPIRTIASPASRKVSVKEDTDSLMSVSDWAMTRMLGPRSMNTSTR